MFHTPVGVIPQHQGLAAPAASKPRPDTPLVLLLYTPPPLLHPTPLWSLQHAHNHTLGCPVPCLHPGTVNPVTDETLRMWGGFVELIVDGYLNKGMKW